MDEAVNPGNVVKLNDDSIEFTGQPAGDFFFSPFTAFKNRKGRWQVSEKKSGLCISEETDFIPEMMNLWGTSHVISPELFIRIELPAGKILQWQRKYRFYYM
jgi:hypothetical protein